MQQRLAFALLIRLTHSPTEIGPKIKILAGTVQATDAPNVVHFRLLHHFKRWLQTWLPPHNSPQPL